MRLFEIVTTSTGESYVRAYCWAADEAEARRLFAERNPGYEIHANGLREILAADSAPFCTQCTDYGWPE